MTRRKKLYTPIQCAWCIDVLKSELRYARHIVSKHPSKIEEYIIGESKKDKCVRSDFSLQDLARLEGIGFSDIEALKKYYGESKTNA